MEFSTPEAVRKIKKSKKDYAFIDGEKTCILKAMTFAIKYHIVDIKEKSGQLFIKGVKVVERMDKYIINKNQ
jgi:hypothetical protein